MAWDQFCGHDFDTPIDSSMIILSNDFTLYLECRRLYFRVYVLDVCYFLYGYCVGTVICFDRLCMATVTEMVRFRSADNEWRADTRTRRSERRSTFVLYADEKFWANSVVWFVSEMWQYCHSKIEISVDILYFLYIVFL